jgi:hypothetical protein
LFCFVLSVFHLYLVPPRLQVSLDCPFDFLLPLFRLFVYHKTKCDECEETTDVKISYGMILYI